ncbi:MAG: preprotein translocase subunit SecY [Planctomycetes bacterium]|nr:preprotein translocase subunit SecY [Planctomycetota bacterium]
MLQAFLNIWRIAELRNKIFFTLAMLAIYRIGFFIPLPGVDQSQLNAWAEKAQGTAAGNLIAYVGIFTGGSLHQSTIFGLGIMPYISASIIFQLLATVVPSLQAMQKEGPAGRQKISEYTRYVTVILCIIQAAFWLIFLQRGEKPLVYADYLNTPTFWLCGTIGLTAGTVFLMWLGEQVDRYGIGNGVSLIITAGIVSRIPAAIGEIAGSFTLGQSDTAQYHPDTVFFLIIAFIVVVAGSIIITQGQRRIPIQQAKHTRGRRVYGGQRSYLPLRVNHGGVMPIIFASSLMILPAIIFDYLNKSFPGFWALHTIADSMKMDGYLYVVLYIALIYFFAYFWTTVQFQPKEMATQLRDHGSFIPGLRPGPRTADYLEIVMERITYVGAGFLAIIAVIPTIISGVFHIPHTVSSFLGGTGLLIVVSVMLDLIQRIEASLMMRNYGGFLGGGGGSGGTRATRIRGPRS